MPRIENYHGEDVAMTVSAHGLGDRHTDRLAMRLQDISDATSDIGGELRGIADRLLGPLSEKVGEGSDRPQACGCVAALFEMVDTIERRLRDMKVTVDRLREL